MTRECAVGHTVQDNVAMHSSLRGRVCPACFGYYEENGYWPDEHQGTLSEVIEGP